MVGDIDELKSHPVPGVHTRNVTAEQQLEAALDGMAFLVTQQAARGRRGRPVEQPAEQSVESDEEPTP